MGTIFSHYVDYNFDVWILARDPMHLGVLRVLIEQTLEINSVVKDSTFPDPSLAKEVKDSFLTILVQVLFDSVAVCGGREHCWRFSAELGRTVLERGVLGGL
jgi:hypothetical protein